MYSRTTAAVSLLMALAGAVAADDAAEREFFENKIRPVLAENCFRCHGPERQKAKLRLDSRDALLKGGETGPAIVPGDLGKSLLVKGISYDDAEFRMPPKGKLPEDAIANLKTWIERGAFWPDDESTKTAHAAEFDLKKRSKHWSLQPLHPPALPSVMNRSWVQASVDHFILAKLEAASIAPNPAADRRTLLRRVTFDIIGLPPTKAEIDAFLADDSPDAFAHVVDRLLDSPHYGERWGRHWLDLVRFAETRGHEFDFEIADAYRYRDYVIRAFNADVPYNQFVLEHLAGDLLSAPRRHALEGFNESILGGGFFFLGEGKHSPVDVRGDQADRRDNQIDVLSKAFLGLTVACARCHDHKFDAISTHDYYALAGILESSRYHRAFLDDPQPTSEKIRQLHILRKEFNAVAVPIVAAALRSQVARLAGMLPQAAPSAGAPPLPFADFATNQSDWFATGFAFANNRGNALRVDDKLAVIDCMHQANSGLLSNRLEGTLQSPTFVITKKKIHLLVAGRDAKVNLIINGFQLIRSPIYGGLTLTINHGEQLRWVAIDVGMWPGQRAYLEVLDDGPGFAALERVVFSDDNPPSLPSLPSADEASLREIIAQFTAGTLAAHEVAAERIRLLNWMLEKTRPFAVEPSGKLAQIAAAYRAIDAALPSPRRAPAMQDGTPVDEYVFIRGNHKKPGEVVGRRFLEVFGGKEDLPPHPYPLSPRGRGEGVRGGSGRLEMARRMIDPAKTPIVPRVLVNRLWKHHFGEGIVRSPDDFGVLGHEPTHPELLDFLADKFVKNRWSIKKMHRLLLLSSTYQMSSAPNARGGQMDPANKLLHRMPVRRLEAEIIRDAVLAVSGRLDATQFGPGVLPHLTPFMAGRGRPKQSGPLDGAGRRSIYINVRRNFLTPMFLAFDYPTPFSTIGRRSVSNVPAQALSMMNNPLVVQQAELWAKRIVAQQSSAEERITQMFETAFARPPSEVELSEALAFVRDNSLADWADFAHVLVNLKEFIFVQ